MGSQCGCPRSSREAARRSARAPRCPSRRIRRPNHGAGVQWQRRQTLGVSGARTRIRVFRGAHEPSPRGFLEALRGLFPAVSELVVTLNELRSRGVRLGIITNGTVRIQESTIDGLGLRQSLDVIVISEREGVRKPDAAIFNRALDSLGISAADAWFVGDNPDVDVAGALAVGVRAFWRRCVEWPPPTVPCDTIRSLDELLPLLSQAAHEDHEILVGSLSGVVWPRPLCISPPGG